MTLLTIGLAFLFAALLPWSYVTSGLGIDLAAMVGISSGHLGASAVRFALQFTLSLPLAVFLLIAFGIGSYAAKLVSGRRWISWGLVCMCAYLVLAPIMFVLSAIPYGGGKVPIGLHLLSYASLVLVAVGIAKAFLLELPRLRGASEEKVRAFRRWFNVGLVGIIGYHALILFAFVLGAVRFS